MEITELTSVEIFTITFIFALFIVLPFFFGFHILRFLTRGLQHLVYRSRTHYSKITKSISIHIDPIDMKKIMVLAEKNKRSPDKQIEYMVKTEIENYETVFGRIRLMDDL